VKPRLGEHAHDKINEYGEYSATNSIKTISKRRVNMIMKAGSSINTLKICTHTIAIVIIMKEKKKKRRETNKQTKDIDISY